MPLSDLTDPAAVDAAMNEFDRIGRDNFLHKYGFGPSRAYFVSRDGKYYDSKSYRWRRASISISPKGPVARG
jgi:putative restriction endonuclease